MLKFSVVIPLYNKSYSIEQCIDSVISQTYKNFEIIIVNDGSTDDSLRKVESLYSEEINDKKITIIDIPNQGASKARNIGVSFAKSKYICFLDADDEWYPDFLIDMKYLIDNYSAANLYCLQHETQVNNALTLKNPCYYKSGYHGYINNFYRASIIGSIANSSKVCIKKDALLNIGCFPENHKSGEDLYVWMELSREGKVAFYNKTSVRVNVISDNSRNGRGLSIPYPFIYYSKPQNINKLSFWSKLYLRKIYISHLKESLKKKQDDALLFRAQAGNKLFPIISKSSIIALHLKRLSKKH